MIKPSSTSWFVRLDGAADVLECPPRFPVCRTTSLEELATVASAISLTDTRGMWNPVESVTGTVSNATSLVSAKRHT